MTFRFQKLTLDQFRCFEHLELALEDDLTLLFAENGGGKTAILHALATGLTPFQAGAQRLLKLDAQRDARKVTLDYGLFFDVDPTHRGIVVIRNGNATATSLMSPTNARIELTR